MRFTDHTAKPGIVYHYTVQHVGTENTHSRHSKEIAAVIPPPSASKDDTAPELTIVSPTQQSWSQFPRIVLHYADGGSGIDPSTLSISFDQALVDETPAEQNIAGQAFRSDDNCLILPMQPPKALPAGELVTLTASISDRAGHTTTRSTRIYVSEESASPPKAVLSAKDLPDHSSPHTVKLDAGKSSVDARILRCEW
ncbi:MAG: hypothetical protein ACI9R3_001759 [Verrucomicrobiales bacterium]